MRAFEIHTFQAGKWKIDSVFDDRDLAMFEARRMDESARYTGVRVVEEVFDENTQQSATKTIFRGTKGDEAPATAKPKPKAKGGGQARAPARGAARPTRQPTGRRPPAEKKRTGTFALIAFLVLLVLGGGGLLYALRFLESAI